LPVVLEPNGWSEIAAICLKEIVSMVRKPAVADALLLMLAGLIHGAGTAASAAPPKINNLSPLGVQRGVATELTVSGANLAGSPRLIAPFRFRIEPASPPAKSDAANWKVRLTAAADVAVGIYPIRIQTDDGISPSFLLPVGQLPQVAEKEDNSSFELAQVLPELPIVVEGQVAGNDVDYFRFHGTKGELIVVDAQCARIGSGIDPTIRLTTAAANRAYISSADDSPGLQTDARLTAVLPADGDYVVELSDSRYQGGGRPVFRLVIGAVPMAAEVYPLGGRAGETVGLEFRGGTLEGVKVAAAAMNPLLGTELVVPRMSSAMLGVDTGAGGVPGGGRTLDLESLSALVASSYPEIREPADPEAPPARAVAPVVLNGRIDPAGDDDRFVLAVTPGQRLRIKVVAYEVGSALDAVLRVLGNGGSALANADDMTTPLPPVNGQPQSLVIPDPTLEFTVPGGTNEITLVLRDLEDRGGVGFPYRIVVEPLLPDFQIVLTDSEVSVPKGGVVAVGVTVQRRGYTGPINTTIADPPTGLSVRPGTIAAGQTTGILSLSAAADASFPAVPIKLVGRAQGVNGPIERLAYKPIVFAQQAKLATCSITEYGLTAAPALAEPVVFDTPPALVEVAHGLSATVPVKVTRSQGADAALAISPFPLPPGLTIAAATIAEKASDGQLTVKAAVTAPLGVMTVGFQAKGKFGGQDQTIDLPAVTLSIVPPATVAIAAPGLEIKPGATVELAGSIVRKGGYDGAVTVKINGLPAGLKADPVTVADKESRFAVKIIADAKAAVTSAETQVALIYQVEKKDYSVGPVPLAVKVVPIK
jgi:hypothetical protein